MLSYDTSLVLSHLNELFFLLQFHSFSLEKKMPVYVFRLSWIKNLLAKIAKICLSVPGTITSFPQVSKAWCAAFALTHKGTKWNPLLASLPSYISLGLAIANYSVFNSSDFPETWKKSYSTNKWERMSEWSQACHFFDISGLFPWDPSLQILVS